MGRIRWLAATLAAAAVVAGCTPDAGYFLGAAKPPAAVGTVKVNGQVTVLADGQCAAGPVPTATSAQQLPGSTTLKLRFGAAAGNGGTSSLAAVLAIEPPMVVSGDDPLPEGELLIPLLMREAAVALHIDGQEIVFDQPSRNGYVSPDLGSGYLSARTANGEAVAINFLCPDANGEGD